MKTKFIKVLGITFLLLGIVVGVVYAFTLGNVDGVWTAIDTNGADYDAWASGPAGGSTNYDSPTTTCTSNTCQGALGGTDWNQVRYGEVPSGAPVTGFGGRSGFGFDGVNDVNEGDGLTENEDFLLGKWCHFNNPIIAASNPLDYVDLNLRVDNITCPSGGTISDGQMNFGYRFYLDETNNTGNGSNCGNETVGWPYNTTLATYQCPYTVGTDPLCPWDGGINGNGCADEVEIGQLDNEDTFTCSYEGGASTEFTIRIVGFVPLADSTAACPEKPAPGATTSNIFISREAQDSCACLYARVTTLGTAVELDYFTATQVEQAVELKWETTSEVNNLGFNIYRKEVGVEGWVKLNEELIPTVVYPGAPFGGEYSFIDAAVEPGKTYSYSLMDLDLDSTASFHGPVEVTITE